jgi:hypothetical protein
LLSDYPINSKNTLHFFSKKNFRISWCGLDGYFDHSPDLFDPKEISNGVFICHSDLDSKYEALTDNELLMLHNVIKNNI